jgi:hypothetical protein
VGKVIETEYRGEGTDEKRYYEVTWVGYDGATWEPALQVFEDVPHLVRKFHRERGEKLPEEFPADAEDDRTSGAH